MARRIHPARSEGRYAEEIENASFGIALALKVSTFEADGADANVPRHT